MDDYIKKTWPHQSSCIFGWCCQDIIQAIFIIISEQTLQIPTSKYKDRGSKSSGFIMNIYSSDHTMPLYCMFVNINLLPFMCNCYITEYDYV